MRLIELNGEDLRWLGESYENRLQLALQIAYLEARSGGKRRTKDEHQFELNVDANLQQLRKEILSKQYRPSRSTAHIVHVPVDREIFAATFKDRIVHHLVVDSVYEWWDKRFIDDSYSCRIGKGTKYGIERLDYHIRAASLNYKKKVYVLKMDVRGYFMSLSREKLYKRAIWGLEQQFANKEDTFEYEIIKMLWHRIIFDDPIQGVKKVGNLKGWKKLPDSKSLFKQAPGVGIVIGNLTSQLLSNIFLDLLDRFIVFYLGYRYYGRYVDDFYIVVTEEELPQLKRDIEVIREYLRTALGLTLHPRKIVLQESSKGVAFLGAVVYHNHVVAGKRLSKNVSQAFAEVAAGKRPVSTVASYLGHLKYMNSTEMIKREFKKVGWEYKF